MVFSLQPFATIWRLPKIMNETSLPLITFFEMFIISLMVEASSFLLYEQFWNKYTLILVHILIKIMKYFRIYWFYWYFSVCTTVPSIFLLSFILFFSTILVSWLVFVAFRIFLKECFFIIAWNFQLKKTIIEKSHKQTNRLKTMVFECRLFIFFKVISWTQSVQ